MARKVCQYTCIMCLNGSLYSPTLLHVALILARKVKILNAPENIFANTNYKDILRYFKKKEFTIFSCIKAI